MQQRFHNNDFTSDFLKNYKGGFYRKESNGEYTSDVLMESI